MYFYRNYYPASSRVIVKAKPAGSTGNATTLASLPISTSDDIKGTFKYVTPANSKSMWYELSLQGQPTRAPWIQYVQNSWARIEVKVSKPTIGDARISGEPGTPNGDGWRDWVYAVYSLGGSPSTAYLKVYDGAWKRIATIPGKTVGGKQALQWNGTHWTRYNLNTSSGATIGNGIYYYIIEARNSLGTATRSGSFFVSRDIVCGRALNTRPQLTSIAPDPASFSPGAGEKTTFRFTTSDWSYVTVKIVSSKGVVRTLCVNAKTAPGAIAKEWDGRDTYGKLLPTGNYRYFVFVSGGGLTAAIDLESGLVNLH